MSTEKNPVVSLISLFLGRASIACVIVFATLVGCSDDSSSSRTVLQVAEPEPEPVPEPQTKPFQEIYDQGITRFLGMYTPMLSEPEGDTVNHFFGAGDGPLCLDGGEYTMSTRDQGSEDLVIFLQGGGACWSELCAATTEASPGLVSAGIMDPNRENNPVKDWNQVYLPYCDGGLFSSDRDTDSDGDGVDDRFQRGLHNLSAALDVALANFPAPRRILLTGSSAGAFGTIFALPLVRYHYPDVRIDLVNDSGVGVSRPDDPSYQALLQEDWNSTAFIPASCEECVAADGHLTEYQIWQLDQDENVRRGMLSYTRDNVIGDAFLQIGGDAFDAALTVEMKQLEDAHPTRQRSWIVEGAKHTFLMAEPDQTADGVPLMDWITSMLDDSDDWVSVRD
jgi:hypothetical protein